MQKFKGLTSKQVDVSRSTYGSNKLTQIEGDPLWKQLLNGFKEPILVVLIVALVCNLVFWLLGHAEWYEAVGIFVALCIANFVGVFSENKQGGKAAKLREEEQAKERAKVIRNGELHEIALNDVVAGDIVVLQSGDKVPADGVIVSGAIKVDQAALNGETKEAKKIEISEYYESMQLENVEKLLKDKEVNTKDLLVVV